MKKIIIIVVFSLVLVALVLGGFYFCYGIKEIKNTDNKWLVDYHSKKRTQVAGVETSPTQSILTGSVQPSGSLNPKSTTRSSNSQPVSQTTTQPDPSSPPPVCDQARKAAITARYSADMANTAAVRDQSKNDARNQYVAELAAINQRYLDIWDPTERERLRARDRAIAAGVLADNLNNADTEYNGRVTVLTLAYNAALRNINC